MVEKLPTFSIGCGLGWVSFFFIGSNDKTSLVIPEKARNFDL